MRDKIKETLLKYFVEYRLVFWYDDKAEMQDLFDSLEFDDVVKITIENNEFNIMHRVLILESEQKFLIYKPSAKPDNSENWLLDLELTNKEFYTESAALFAQELGIAYELLGTVREHIEFFNNQDRRKKLQRLLDISESQDSLRLKMIASICGTEVEFEKILFELFSELLSDLSESDELFISKSDKYANIEKFKLDKFFWDQVSQKYKYSSDRSSIRNFVIELFTYDLFNGIDNRRLKLNNNATILINHWKENIKYLSAYKTISNELATELRLNSFILNSPPEAILLKDTFDFIDKQILIEIKNRLVADNYNYSEIQTWIKERRNKTFYADYELYYSAVSLALEFFEEISRVDYQIIDYTQGFNSYTKQYYKVDSYYRQYIATTQRLDKSMLADINDKIERIYGNTYLPKLSNSWQSAIDRLEEWQFPGFNMQRDFYNSYAKRFEGGINRLFVIISDAFRYEIAPQFVEMIKKENKYDAELEFQISGLPSYTQLGMAALLPNSSLSFKNDGEIVEVDGISSSGTDNRTKILQKNYAGSIAIKAEDFQAMKAHSEGREFVKPYKIIYIYSNIIDKIGDNRESEHRVFAAVEDEIQNIFKLIKHITNMNGTNVIVTADHGFIYQHTSIDSSDFTDYEPKGELLKVNRRFVIGKSLESDASVRYFAANQLGISGNTEVLIPKSNNRIKVKGSGSRFVHGGASLQEIVIPIVKVNKKRTDDIKKIEVDLIASGNKITTNRIGLRFYQNGLVSDKVLKRNLKIAFYTMDKKLISDVFQRDFDNESKDDAAMEVKHNFTIMSDMSSLDDKTVLLVFEEILDDKSIIYKEIEFTLALSFYNEFDD